MRIPHFFTRIRAYGTNEVIGVRSKNAASQNQDQDQDQSQSQSHCPSKLVIVDGPSLAHFLFDELTKGDHADKRAECFHRYATIGENAIHWLDNVASFGWEIEGIYFDGALPACKRQTRLDRLQKYATNLTRYKQEARYAQDKFLSTYDPTLAYCYRSMKRLDRAALSKARNNLPPPPFLVSAVIETLFGSHYADKTRVVDGEADEFCMAAAYERKSEARRAGVNRPVSVYTNDSDLIVWPAIDKTRIHIIREMSELPCGTGAMMKVLSFGLETMSTSAGYQLKDFVKPAFKLRDPKVTVAQALKDTINNDNSEEFTEFAGQYDVRYALVKLKHQYFQRRNNTDLCIHEPRVSEFVRQYLSTLLRNLAEVANADSSNVKAKLDLTTAATWALEGDRKSTWEAARVVLEPLDPFDFYTSSAKAHPKKGKRTKPPLRLEMYLPALLEDPDSVAAWHMGATFRDIAETLLMLPFQNRDTTVLEYRRSGTSIATRTVKQVSINNMDQDFAACLGYFRNALLTAKKLEVRSQWRFSIMQLTLSDLHQMQQNKTGANEPKSSEVLSIINGSASSGWSTIHLYARYHAEYFSLRMLRDVLRFCQDRTEFQELQLPESLLEFGRMLEALPPVVQFFATDDPDIGASTWQALSEDFVNAFEEPG